MKQFWDWIKKKLIFRICMHNFIKFYNITFAKKTERTAKKCGLISNLEMPFLKIQSPPPHSPGGVRSTLETTDLNELRDPPLPLLNTIIQYCSRTLDISGYHRHQNVRLGIRFQIFNFCSSSDIIFCSILIILWFTMV